MSIKNPAWLAGEAVPAYNEARESFNKNLRKSKSQWSAVGALNVAGMALNAFHFAFTAKSLVEAGASPGVAGMALAGAAVIASLVFSVAFLTAATATAHSVGRRRALTRGVAAAEASLSNSRELYPTAEGSERDPFSRLVAIRLANDQELKRLRAAVLGDALEVAVSEHQEGKQAARAAKKARHAM